MIIMNDSSIFDDRVKEVMDMSKEGKTAWLARSSAIRSLQEEFIESSFHNNSFLRIKEVVNLSGELQEQSKFWNSVVEWCKANADSFFCSNLVRASNEWKYKPDVKTAANLLIVSIDKSAFEPAFNQNGLFLRVMELNNILKLSSNKLLQSAIGRMLQNMPKITRDLLVERKTEMNPSIWSSYIEEVQKKLEEVAASEKAIISKEMKVFNAISIIAASTPNLIGKGYERNALATLFPTSFYNSLGDLICVLEGDEAFDRSMAHSIGPFWGYFLQGYLFQKKSLHRLIINQFSNSNFFSVVEVGRLKEALNSHIGQDYGSAIYKVCTTIESSLRRNLILAGENIYVAKNEGISKILLKQLIDSLESKIDGDYVAFPGSLPLAEYIALVLVKQTGLNIRNEALHFLEPEIENVLNSALVLHVALVLSCLERHESGFTHKIKYYTNHRPVDLTSGSFGEKYIPSGKPFSRVNSFH